MAQPGEMLSVVNRVRAFSHRAADYTDYLFNQQMMANIHIGLMKVIHANYVLDDDALFENTPRTMMSMKLKYTYVVLFHIFVRTSVLIHMALVQAPIPIFDFIWILGYIGMFLLLRIESSGQWMGYLLVGFQSVVVPLCESSRLFLHIKAFIYAPMSTFCLGKTGIVIHTSCYLLILGLDRFVFNFLDDAMPDMSKFSCLMVLTGAVCLFGFQWGTEFFEQGWDATMIYRTEIRSRMSHELRTPLFSIVAAGSLLKRTNVDKWQGQLLHMIEGCTQNLVNIVNTLLDITKLQSVGGLEVNIQVTNVKEIMKNIFQIVKPMALMKDLELELSIDESTPEIIDTDPMRFQQVLVNLLSNSLKYTFSGKSFDGKVIVRISSAIGIPESDFPIFTGDPRLSAHKRMLKVIVSDNGIGMDPPTLHSLFTPFQTRANPSTHPGSGLGLLLSKYLLQRLGGVLAVKSNGKNMGSEFAIFLPVSSEREPLTNDFAEFKDSALPTFTHSLSPGQVTFVPNKLVYSNATPTEFTNTKLLSADDNALNQYLLDKMCATFNIKLDVVEDGGKVIEIARNYIEDQEKNQPPPSISGLPLRQRKYYLPYDAILLDLEMPVLDGANCARMLRELGVCNPLVILSAHPLNVQQRLLQGQHVEMLLTKPFTAEAFASALASLLPDKIK